MPDNSDRAYFAEKAVEAFIRECSTDDEDAIADLICNLCHLSDSRGEDAIANVRRGLSHHYAETHHEQMATISITIEPDNATRLKPKEKPNYQAAYERASALLAESLNKWEDEEPSVQEEKSDHIEELNRFFKTEAAQLLNPVRKK